MQYLVFPYVRHLCILLPLVRPHIRHMCVLLPLVMPHVRHAHLGLHIAVSLKGRTTLIWSFGCGFSSATTMGCTEFKLPFCIIFVLNLLTIIKQMPENKGLSSIPLIQQGNNRLSHIKIA